MDAREWAITEHGWSGHVHSLFQADRCVTTETLLVRHQQITSRNQQGLPTLPILPGEYPPLGGIHHQQSREHEMAHIYKDQSSLRLAHCSSLLSQPGVYHPGRRIGGDTAVLLPLRSDRRCAAATLSL